MNKKDLVLSIAKKASLTVKASREVLKALEGAISGALKKGERVIWTGMGTFRVQARKARQGINPRTKEKMSIAARKTPAFTAGRALKRAIK